MAQSPGQALKITSAGVRGVALPTRVSHQPDLKNLTSGPAGYVNDVGPLAAEVDETSGELLGNFPQAFSHIGLVNAAWATRGDRAPQPVNGSPLDDDPASSSSPGLARHDRASVPSCRVGAREARCKSTVAPVEEEPPF
jgi:hypothetical protein